MGRTNYSFAKRQREIAKKQKKEAKRLRKAELRQHKAAATDAVMSAPHSPPVP